MKNRNRRQRKKAVRAPERVQTASLQTGKNLCLGDGLDLAEHTLGQILHCHAAAGGLGGEVLCVHLVESSKTGKARQITREEAEAIFKKAEENGHIHSQRSL